MASSSSMSLTFKPIIIITIIITFIITPYHNNMADSADSSASSNYPPVSNLALNRPITVQPSEVTCGMQVPTVYCQSSDSQDSTTNCLQATCSALCPWRSNTPSPSNLLQRASGIDGLCLRSDPVNIAPTNSNQSSITFLDLGAQCYLTPLKSTNQKLGPNGSLTLTAWLWPSMTSGRGTVIVKYTQTDKETYKVNFKLLLSKTSLTFAYDSPGFGYLEQSTPVDLQLNTWSFIAVQIYMDRLSFFINPKDEQPIATMKLKSVLENEGESETANFRIGQNSTGGEQYIGRMQDLYFYNITLSNREIVGVYKGSIPKVRIQSECFCPGQYPLVQGINCFENKLDGEEAKSMPRVSPLSHTLYMANDGDLATYFLTNPVEGIVIEIDLEDAYEIFFVKMTFYSPLPDWVTIEKSVNFNDYRAWQNYARDCDRSFNMTSFSSLDNSSSVNCLPLDYSLSGGTITFNILTPDRPNYQNPETSPDLSEFMISRRVRITMSGHMPGLSIRHSYFGISEIEVMGRCDCNGHATTCNATHLSYTCSCSESSSAEGDKCEKCKPLFNNKPFNRGSPCQPCECHNHSQSCSYIRSIDPFPTNQNLGGGGVCDFCQDNTEGNNCELCKDGFYRPEGVSLTANDVCRFCNCSSAGSLGSCERVGGQCQCKKNVESRQCDQCKPGFFNLQSTDPVGCEDCSCNSDGTIMGPVSGAYQCQSEFGQCPCKIYVEGLKCDRCKLGFYGKQASDSNGCRPCNCNAQRSLSPTCDQVTGQCQCRENFGGPTCDACIDNYYLVSNLQISCRACNCDVRGSIPNLFCNKSTGTCICQPNVIGVQCNTCRDNYFNLTSNGCKPCSCEISGVANADSACDVITGICKCRPGVEGNTCNKCKTGYYNNSLTSTGDKTPTTSPCSPCNCDVIGSTSCDSDTGLCACKANRTGDKCDTCLTGYYADVSGSCIPCICNEAGTITNSPCDPHDGQCQCKGGGSGVGGLRCDGCQPTYWGFDTQLGRCRPCDCDSSGSIDNNCSQSTGQCNCKEFTTSRQCNLCMNGTSGLSGSNPYGCSKAPGGIKPLVAKELSSKFIHLTWESPSQPNGILEEYTIFRNRVAIFNSSINTTDYNDTSLTPYTKYTYALSIRNDFGSAQSSPSTYETLQDIPNGSLDFKILETSSRQAKLSWKAPNSSNGVINKYVVRQYTGFNDRIRLINESTQYAIRFQGLAFQALVDSLTPYSNVTFDIQACTIIGCLTSQSESTITLEDAPANQGPPNVQPINSSALFITWSPPKQPNGIIIFYELWLRKQSRGGASISQSTMLFHPYGQYNPISQSLSSLNPPITNYTAQNLDPYTYYEFKVVSENSRGKTESTWIGNTTGETAPIFVSPPNLTSINSSAVRVTWSNNNSNLNGIGKSFSVCYVIGSNELEAWKCINLEATIFSYVIQNLPSYVNITVLITACNSVACKNSSVVMTTVVPSVPSGQSAPVVIPHNSTSLTVSWSPPKILNGPDPSYAIIRHSPSFNKPPIAVENGDTVVPFNGIGYYRLPADTIPQDSYYTGIKFSFKTRATDGLILLAATPSTQIEYLAVYLENSDLIFAFDTQDCPTQLVYGDGTFNTDTWQSVIILREGNYAYIQINDGQTVTTNSSCANNMIGLNSGLYVGGIPKDFSISDFSILKNFKFKNFYGCLMDLAIMTQGPPLSEIWTSVDWLKIDQSKRNTPIWMGCKTNQQLGIRFLGTGYLTVRIDALDGRSITDVFLSFQSQSKNGLILFAYGAIGSYYIVYMSDGLLNWNVSINGIATSYIYNAMTLCDGKAHPIRLVIDLTSGSMELNIDGNRNVQQLNNDENSRGSGFFLSSYFYIGGIPSNSDVLLFMQRNGITSIMDYHFSGCIDPSLRVASGQVLKIGQIVDGLDIDMSGCPSSVGTSYCLSMTDRFQTVYNGSDLFTFVDAGLDKFTEYMYAVEAYNSAGKTTSQWMLSRTLEGAPSLVPAPSVVKLSKGQLKVTWTTPDPSYYTGSILKYVVKLYCYQNSTTTNGSSIMRDQCFDNETVVDGKLLNVVVTNALPYTNYNVRLVACTRGGCTESSGTMIETDPDAPSDVRPPFALTNGPSYIVVGWFYPGRTNGEMVGFTLVMRGVVVYTGLLTSYNISELSVYTSYQFNVMVCNTIKCMSSEDVQLMTSQLPPTDIDSPIVTLIDARKMKVEWMRPSQSNGILGFYLIYLSQLIDRAGSLAYNTSDPGITMTYLNDLTPDVTYFVSVSACTDAGCTRSRPSSLKMPEGIPENVLPPVVMSTGPTQLNATWFAPGKPNGIILYYLVYKDGFLLTNVSNAGSQLINDLQPWSKHTVQYKVCTIKGCSQSSEVTAYTLEAAPEGTIDLRVIEATSNEPGSNSFDDGTTIKILNLVLKKVNALWNPVQRPNSLVNYWVMFEGPFYDLQNVDPTQISSFDYKKIITTKILFSTNLTSLVGSWITINNLLPFSTYRAYVNASNSVGYILSNYVTVTTSPAEPDGLNPPLLTSPSPTSMFASWRGPLVWNSNEAPLFQLQFENTGASDDQIVNIFASLTSATSYLKSGLRPYTFYSFRLVAINSHGSKFSDWSLLVTRQDVPFGLDSPTLLNITSRSITLSWQPPLISNGIILSYQIFGSNNVNGTYPGNVSLAEVGGLTPFSNYSFILRACTVAGCTESETTRIFITLADAPEGVVISSAESLTSNSVLVIWKTPLKPNGIIIQYELWRRSQCILNITGNNNSSSKDEPALQIKVFTPGNDSYFYLDNSLLPYTCYQYQLVVRNHKLSANSSWASVMTKSARPAGLLAPFSVAYNSTAILVTWFPPQRMNGLLISYVVVIGQLIRIQISNISINSWVVSDLSPFTEYVVSVIACTEGGCTESPQTIVKTDSANPEGLLPPLATPISQIYISISWSKPSKPNGPVSNYELLRMMIAQPLIDNPVGLNNWLSVYNGDLLTFHDVGLSTFTTYIYRLDFYNGAGISSKNSSAVTTFSGIPIALPRLNITIFKYSLVRLFWNIPDVKLLQGRIDQIDIMVYNQSDSNNPCYINRLTRSTNSTDENDLPSYVDLFNLRPETSYLATMTFKLYGDGRIYNVDALNFTTPNGVPEDLSPPTYRNINDSSIQIFWVEPKISKGPIVAYYILVNDNKIDPNTNQSGSYFVNGLLPYTIYNISIQACTEYACVTSQPTILTTKESAPDFMSPPKVIEIIGQKIIQITWDPPLRSNGIILTYELYKRQRYEDCIRKPSNTNECKNVVCNVLEAFCGDQCYSGYKICCNGILYPIQPGYECCGSVYIPSRKNENDICCGGEFHAKMDDYQCCKGWYAKVLSGQVCCKDPTEDRVVVDYGDSCCDAAPYHYGMSQLCCGGQLHSKLSNQCCGDKIIDSSFACCHGIQDIFSDPYKDNQTVTGDGLSYKWYSNSDDFTCCGLDYIPWSSGICCVDQSNRWKVHLYSNGNQTELMVQKCCGLDLVSDSLDCCGGISYNNKQEVCTNVDSSGLYTGCGQGKTCLKTSSNQIAACGFCEFDSIKNRCYTAHPSQPIEEDVVENIDVINSPFQNGCYGQDILIYAGLNTIYEDKAIEAYTNYSYYVIAINSVGISTSNSSNITTSPGIPQDVTPPKIEVDPTNPYHVILTWSAPGLPNGPILWYAILRDSAEISRIIPSTSPSSRYSYTDDNAVVPYRMYKYSIQVCTSAGCNNSKMVSVMTKQGIPDPFNLPIIRTTNSTSLEIKWNDSNKANGFITRYVIDLVRPIKRVIELLSEGRNYERDYISNHSYIVTDLTPFTNYTFKLSICTQIGCTTSDTFGGMTSSDLPIGLESPLLLIYGSIPTVEVSWSQPIYANGKLLQFGIERSWGGLSFGTIFVLQLNSTSYGQVYNDTNVTPGSQYIYRIYFTTSAGKSTSPESSIFVTNSVPDFMPEITNASVLSDSSVYVAWIPGANNPPPGSYNLLVITSNSIFTMVTKKMTQNTSKYSQNITNLQPYTSYTIRIQGCLTEKESSCGTSPSQVKLRTNPAAPLNQVPPFARALNAYSISVWWFPPAQPNGPISKYLLYRDYKEIGNQNLSPSSIVFPTEILVANVPSNVTEFTDTNLTPFSTYQYRILTIGVAGETSSNYYEVQTLEAPPEAQTEPEITMVSSSEAKACWEPPLIQNGVITQYVLTFNLIFISNTSAMSSTPTFIKLNGTTQCAIVSGLLPYSNYTATITSTNSAGSITSNESPMITTQESSPSGIEPPSAEAVTEGRSVILTWKKPTHQNGMIIFYIIYLKNVTSNDNQSINTSYIVYKGLSLQSEIGNLTPYTRYLSKLEACTNNGCARSQWREFITAPAAPPNAPEIRDRPSTTTSSVNLQWTIPSLTYGPLTKLEVYRSVSTQEENSTNDATDNSFKLIYEETVNENQSFDSFTYNDTNVQPYNFYRYFLRMHNKAGYVDSPTIAASTPQAPPSLVAPPTIEWIPFEFDKLLVKWSDPENANGVIKNYLLNRSDYQAAWYFPANSTKQYVDNNLMAYTIYQYAVSVCTDGGCTTSEFESKRTSETAPESVEPPHVLEALPTSLNVNWSTPRITNGEIDHYELHIDSKIIYSGLEMSFNITDLTPYTTYSLSLVACTSGGCKESEVAKATTEQAAPDLLEPPELFVMSFLEIKVTWMAPLKPNGPMVLFELRRNGSLVDIIKNIENDSLANPDSDIKSKIWTFFDKDVNPATTYSYEITAYNPIGKISSQLSIATTPASSPIGVSNPTLEARSSTAIFVSWGSPLKPNGEITSYGVYISTSNPNLSLRVKRDIQQEPKNSKLVYRGLNMSILVNDLQPFTDYVVSVQACTSAGCSTSEERSIKTLGGVPENQAPPLLSSFSNLNSTPEVGVKITWLPPEKLNGILLQYMLFRRQYMTDLNYDPPGKLLYAGTELNFTDLDPVLLPYILYQYRVMVVNSIGSANSNWRIILTSEGTPKNIPSPIIENITSTNVMVKQDPPLKPNGEILNYTLHLIHSSSIIKIFTGAQSHFILWELSPATIYSINVVICNKVACASSPVIECTTNSVSPVGLSEPIISNVTSDSLMVSWQEPANKNGFNLSYQLLYWTTCPYPYSLDINNRPIGYKCDKGPNLIGYLGTALDVQLTNLIPFMKYFIQLICCNEAGCSKITDATATTLADVPQYRHGNPPIISLHQNYLNLNWSRSFFPNGPIILFTLIKDGLVQYAGSSISFTDNLRNINTSYVYRITLTTEFGSASSPSLFYAPYSSHLEEMNQKSEATNNVTKTFQTFDDSKQFYREKWFIIIVAVPSIGIFIFIIFVIIICCIKHKRKTIPYLRETGDSYSPEKTNQRSQDSSSNGLVYQVPVDFQEYASPAFSDEWSTRRSSIASSPAKYSNDGQPEELDPWKYMEHEHHQRSVNKSPPFSTDSSRGSLTIAEIIGSKPGASNSRSADSNGWANEDEPDRLHIPNVTMPGVDEEDDDSGLQSFVENIIFKDDKGTSRLPDSKI